MLMNIYNSCKFDMIITIFYKESSKSAYERKKTNKNIAIFSTELAWKELVRLHYRNLEV